MDDETLGTHLSYFLNSLISLLWVLLCRDSSHLVSAKHQLKVTYEKLRFLRTALKGLDHFDEAVENQIGVLLCHAGTLICRLQQTDVDLCWISDQLRTISVIRTQIVRDAPKTSDQCFELGAVDYTDIVEGTISDGNEKEGTISSLYQHQQGTPQVVGFQNDEINSILDRLTRGSKQLCVVPIYGMGGVGKNTMALKLYNHPSVMHHFQARAWWLISQVFDKKKVLLELLNQTQRECYTLAMDEEDLANKLRQSLKGKAYLIFLDDVWDNEVWNGLAESFPDDSTQSRIILTSRHRDIAPRGLLIDGEIHECLEILKARLFAGSNRPLELSEFGMKFAEKCKGLPLTAVLVAGLLATTKQEGWKQILDALNTVDVSGETLELSYKHLPDYLQPCFLYFGAFSEDVQISVRRLILLWMAEGFVRKNDLKRMEDVARAYLDELIQRSLVMVGRRRSIPGVKTCRIHDLVRDFCVAKAKQDNFFHLLQQRHNQLSGFNEPVNLKKLFIHSGPNHFKESELFCPGTRSLMILCPRVFFFDMPFIIQIFKLLKVLDIESMGAAVGIPKEIELLTQLKYLSFSSSIPMVPSSIGNLSNLETFLAYFWSDQVFRLPHTIWNLQKLHTLDIRSIRGNCCFSLPIENLENSAILLGLESIRGAIFHPDQGIMEMQMRKFPNIRRLECRIECGILRTDESNKYVVPEFLTQLSICGSGKLKFKFHSSNEHLQKVSLEGLELCREDIQVIGKLSKLGILKLRSISYLEGTLEMGEGEFSQLRALELHDDCNGLQKWTASDDQLPCLQNLVLSCCRELKEIPSCFEASMMLEEIEVVDCSSDVTRFVREIEELHKDFGYSIKVYSHSLEVAEEEEM